MPAAEIDNKTWAQEFRTRHKLNNPEIAELTGYSDHAVQSWFKSGPSGRQMPDTARRTLELWEQNKAMRDLLLGAESHLPKNSEIRKTVREFNQGQAS